MGLHTYERTSGLLVSEEAAVPRAIAASLRRLDRGLELRPEVDRRYHTTVWRVYQAVPDRPSVWLFDWRENLEDGNSRPRPLSSSIVDEAAARRVDSRRPFADPMVLNDRLAEIADREDTDDFLEAAREVERNNGRLPAFHRSVGLRMAHDRARRRR